MLAANATSKSKPFPFTLAGSSLLAAEPRTQPALCLSGILGDLAVKPVDGSVEVLAGLAGVLLTTCLGLVPLLLCFDAEGVVLGLGFGTVLLSLVLRIAAVLFSLLLCILAIGPELLLRLLRLGTSAVGLGYVSTC